MSIFDNKIKLKLSSIVFFALLLLLIVVIIIYIMIKDPSSMWGALLGSLAAGLLVALIQYIIVWRDYAESEKLKELKLVEVLYSRSDKTQYEQYIRSANRELDVMGVTGVRLFRDFADTSIGAPNGASVLVSALEKGVKVRLLLPNEAYVPQDKINAFNEVKQKYFELKKHHANLELRYFNHTPAHSIFRIDDTCIIGPVFPNLESRNTPALRLMRSSPVALKYLDYFDEEWAAAKEDMKDA